jgi:hypothetical protein
MPTVINAEAREVAFVDASAAMGERRHHSPADAVPAIGVNVISEVIP